MGVNVRHQHSFLTSWKVSSVWPTPATFSSEPVLLEGRHSHWFVKVTDAACGCKLAMWNQSPEISKSVFSFAVICVLLFAKLHEAKHLTLSLVILLYFTFLMSLGWFSLSFSCLPWIIMIHKAKSDQLFSEMLFLFSSQRFWKELTKSYQNKLKCLSNH